MLRCSWARGREHPSPGARPGASIIAGALTQRPTHLHMQLPGSHHPGMGNWARHAGGNRVQVSRPPGLTRTQPAGSRLTGSQDHAGLTPPRVPGSLLPQPRALGNDCCWTHLPPHSWWWWFSPSVVSDSHDPGDYNLPGSSVHGILQAGTLEVSAIHYSRRPSRPKD